MTTYFVIRHKPTGTLLSARVMATHFGFNTPQGVFEPRLFSSERAAKNCATLWAQGIFTRDLVTESDYEPDNCRWATRKEQSMNTRKNSKLGCESI